VWVLLEMGDPEVKGLQPFLQRAAEVAKLKPKVAFYLREFVVSQGLKVEDRSPELQKLLETVIEQMETQRATLGKLDREADHLEMERFAMEIFDKADRVDRAGAATESTAKTFYAAVYFIQALETFGELPDELVKKARYSLWKAADIRKAIREGRQPTPGGAGEESAAAGAPGPGAASSRPSDGTASVPGTDRGSRGEAEASAFPQPPMHDASRDPPVPRPPPPPFFAGADPRSAPPPQPPQPSSYPTSFSQAPPPQAPAPAMPFHPPAVSEPPTMSYRPSPPPSALSAVAEARRFAKHAVSALDFDDVAAARSYLTQALQTLDRCK